MLSKNVNLAELKHNRDIAFYFRYPLHHRDFHELHAKTGNSRLLGYVASKPLYGKLTPEGRVDRSAGFDGRIAVIFMP